MNVYARPSSQHFTLINPLTPPNNPKMVLLVSISQWEISRNSSKFTQLYLPESRWEARHLGHEAPCLCGTWERMRPSPWSHAALTHCEMPLLIRSCTGSVYQAIAYMLLRGSISSLDERPPLWSPHFCSVFSSLQSWWGTFNSQAWLSAKKKKTKSLRSYTHRLQDTSYGALSSNVWLL